MIDFNTSQLTWIVISSMSVGGVGYIQMDDKVQQVDTRVAISQTKLQSVDDKLADLQKQLVRIEDKLDRRQGLK